MSTHAVFTFGRFNPPTKAHQHIIEWGANHAHIIGADYFLFPSPSEEKHIKKGTRDSLKIKNPIPFSTKTAILRRLFPTINIVEDRSIYSPQQVIEYLISRGYTNATFVVGSDRVETFNARWLPYALEEFKSAKVISAAERKYDTHGIESMSATAARQAAMDDNFMEFVKATSVGNDRTILLELFVETRTGMGIKRGTSTDCRAGEQPV